MLTHLTKNWASLCDILRDGALYRRNDSPVLDRLTNNRIPADRFNPNGMVCFTAATAPFSAQLRKDFGEYAIGVDRAWAERMGARPVAYIDKAKYQNLLSAFEATRPRVNSVGDVPSGSHIDAYVEELIMTQPAFATSIGADPAYLKLLEDLQFVEDAGFAEEQEWRIRVKKGIGMSFDPEKRRTRPEEIELLKITRRIPGIQPLASLLIPPAVCIEIRVPYKEEHYARDLSELGYKDIPLKLLRDK